MKKRNLWMLVALPLLAVAALPSARAQGAARGWWPQLSGPANDFAVANLGQLKNMAAHARDHLDDATLSWGEFPGGAGAVIDALFDDPTDGWDIQQAKAENIRPLNLGQLKHVASLYYDRLVKQRFAAGYPWTEDSADDGNYAPANLGQLKNVFSFDLALDADTDGLPDMWEETVFGGTGLYAAADDPDEDGLDNAAEVSAGTDPLDADSDGDGQYDGIDEGLLVHLPFDQLDPPVNGEDGVVTDASGGGHHGNVFGAQIDTYGGVSWGSIEFVETDDRVRFQEDALLQGEADLTVAFWVKAPEPAGGGNTAFFEAGSIWGVNEFMLLRDGGNDRIRMYTGEGSTFVWWDDPGVLDGTWHHLAFVRDATGDSASLYVDGAAVPGPNDPNPTINPIDAGDEWCVVGLHQSVADPTSWYASGLVGEMDELRVYTRVMAAGEVANLHGSSGDVDGDGDGVPDDWYTIDSDADGLADWWEVAYFGSISETASTGDPDGDLLDNWGEFAAGTNPLDADSDDDGVDDKTEIDTPGSNPLETLVGYWLLDEESGAEAQDATPFRRPGVVTGAVWSPAFGAFRGGLSFVNAGDCLALPARALHGAGSMTLSAWFKTGVTETPNGETRTIFSSATTGGDPDLALRVDAGGGVSFDLGGGVSNPLNVQGPAAINDGEWHHLAAVKDAAADEARIYLDGTELGTSIGQGVVAALDVGPGLLVAGQEFGPAGSGWVSDNGFVGTLDEIAVYRHAIPGVDIAAIWNRDDDSDGLPDRWERAYLETLTQDGKDDADGDGYDNATEFASGTDPIDATDPALDGLVVQYPFENDNGKTITDAAAATVYNGTYTEFTNPDPDPAHGGHAQGVFGRTLGFGYYNGISIPPATLDDAGDFTVTFRINVSEFDEEGVDLPLLTAGDGSVALGFVPPDQTFIEAGGTGRKVWDHHAFELNSWTEVTLVRDKTNALVTLYLDGIDQGTIADPGGALLDLQYTTLWFGNTAGVAGGENFFDGEVDDIMLFRRALDASDVAARQRADGGGAQGIPDIWERDLLIHMQASPGTTVNGEASHPDYGISNADAAAQGLDPAGGDLLTIERLMSAVDDRYLATLWRDDAEDVLNGESPSAPFPGITWHGVGTPPSLDDYLGVLNQISLVLDALKRHYLNADDGLFTVGERIGLDAGYSEPDNYTPQMPISVPAGIRPFDDDTLPPLGRVTRENYPAKIRQAAVMLGKLRYLRWPIKATLQVDSHEEMREQFPEEPENPDPCDPPVEILEWQLKETNLKLPPSSGGDSTDLDATGAIETVDTGISYDNGLPGEGDVISSATWLTALSTVSHYSGTISVLEYYPWSYWGADVPGGAGSIEDFGLGQRVGAVAKVSKDSVKSIIISEMRSASFGGKGIEVDKDGQFWTPEEEDPPKYQFYKYSGTFVPKISDTPPVSPTVTDYLREAIYYPEPNPEDPESVGPPSTEYAFESPGTGISAYGVFAPKFPNELPEPLGATIPSYGSGVPLGDFACDTGLAKLVVPLGVGVRSPNQEACLAILLRYPWEGREGGAIYQPYERHRLGIGHRSALSLLGSKADYDIVYETDFTEIETLEFPTYVSGGLNAGASEQQNPALDETDARVGLWTQSRIRQVRGAHILVDIQDSEEPGSTGYHIDLYWAGGNLQENTDGSYAVGSAGAKIRRITVEDETVYGAPGIGAAMKLKVTSGTRVYVLQSTGGGDEFSQEWQLQHDYDGANGNDTDITATYVLSGGTATHTFSGTRDTHYTVDSETEYINAGKPFDPFALVSVARSGTNTEGVNGRTVSYAYGAATDNPFLGKEPPTGVGTGSWMRLNTVTFAGDTAWDQNGRVDRYNYDPVGETHAGNWNNFAGTVHTIDGQTSVTNITGDGDSEHVLADEPVSNADVALSDALATRTVTAGGAATVVKYHTAGPYAWTVRSVTHPDGTGDQTLYKVSGSDGSTRITSTHDGPGDRETVTNLDPYGVLENTMTTVDGVRVSQTRVTKSHRSGAPEEIAHLGTEVREKYEYYDHGKVKSHTPPGGGKTEFEYDAITRIKKVTEPKPGGGSIVSTHTHNADGEPGFKIDTPQVSTIKETHDFHGDLLVGNYGTTLRPTTVTVTRNPTVVTTTEGNNVTSTRAYAADGALSGYAASDQLFDTSYSVGVTEGDKMMFRETRILGLDAFERVVFDTAGRVKRVERPSGADASQTAAWAYGYAHDTENKTTTVTVTDPDEVATETAYNGDRLSSAGYAGFEPLTFGYGQSADGGLGSSMSFDGKALGVHSYNPSTGATRFAPRGFSSQAIESRPQIRAGAIDIDFNGPSGLKGSVKSQSGYYQEASGSSSAGGFSNKVARHPDLSLHTSSGTVAGRTYGSAYRQSDGAPTDLDSGALHYDITPTEQDGGGYHLGIKRPGSGSWEVLSDVSGSGASKKHTAEVSGTGLISAKLETEVSGSQIESDLQTGGGPVTEFRSERTGLLKTKELPEDASPSVNLTHTPAGRLASSTNARGSEHEVNRQQGSPFVDSITSPDATTDVEFEAVGGSVRVSSIKDISGKRTRHLDGNGQLKMVRYEDTAGAVYGDVFDEVQIWRPALPDGSPLYLLVTEGGEQDPGADPDPAASVLLDVGFTYSGHLSLGSAGSANTTTARLEKVSVPGLYEAIYGHGPPPGGDPARRGVGSLRHIFAGKHVIETEFAYYGSGEIGGDAYPGKLEERRTEVFPGQSTAGGEISFAYAHNDRGHRDAVTVGDGADLLTLYHDAAVWTLGYSQGGAYAGMLTEADYNAAGGGKYIYTYNGLGVRLSDKDVTTYLPNAQGNRLASIQNGLTFTYDADGNRTNESEGNLKFVWDDRDRLSQVLRVSDDSKVAEYLYDSEGRRHSKTLYDTDGTTVLETRHYLWDGWDLVLERVRDETGALVREKSYIWGLDIDETTGGAGGVGGLLLIIDADLEPSGSTEYSIPVYDGGGNVVALVDAPTGAVVAEYAYGPYGEDRGSAGARAASNPFRFSTKYQDAETELYYYGYRYLDTAMGTWLSRDPLGERGGLNLYGFVGNDPANGVDYLGLNIVTRRGTQELIELLGGRTAVNLAKAKTFRGLFSNHHIIPKSLWKRHAERLIALGFERDSISNLILLPRNAAAELVVKTGRAMHKGFPWAHRLYNDDLARRVGSILGDKALSDAGKRAAILDLRKAIREKLENGTVDLTTKKAMIPVGQTGIVLIGTTFVGVVEGSPAHEYINAVERYQWDVGNFLETQEMMHQWTGKSLTVRGRFDNPGMWGLLDWINPVEIVQAGVALGTSLRAPEIPVMSESLKAELVSAELMMLRIERMLNPSDPSEGRYKSEMYEYNEKIRLMERYDLDSNDPLELYHHRED